MNMGKDLHFLKQKKREQRSLCQLIQAFSLADGNTRSWALRFGFLTSNPLAGVA
jgi:hypothetical protein